MSSRKSQSLARRLAIALCGAAFSLGAFAAPGSAQIVSKTEPEFPREAVQAGIDKGLVKARMTIDGSGEVTRVEVLDAQPRRVFDRAVVKTLSQWRFNSGDAGRLVEIDVNFTR